jgi:hypothetical protein
MAHTLKKGFTVELNVKQSFLVKIQINSVAAENIIFGNTIFFKGSSKNWD